MIKDKLDNLSILVLSCDKYKNTWKPFFTLLDKYYHNHNETYLSTETLYSSGADWVINTNSDIWSERFREALKIIDTDYVLVMLDDFFIRRKVNDKLIAKALSTIIKDENIAVINFEKDYRKSDNYSKEFNKQRNMQVYLNSCQPSIWDRKILIDRLKENENAWQWETKTINSYYTHLINNNQDDFIIDIGYNHTLDWGISRGKLTNECKTFLAKEGFDIEW
jgi:hypothetical protein